MTLRELKPSDAAALFAVLGSPEVRPFMWAPPPSAAAFEQFIEWARAERATGKYICYGVVPRGETSAAGVFELRQQQPGFLRGELGFVMDPRLWGGGVFEEGARLMLDFAFHVVKIHRIEARAATDNGRGNSALRKLGARRKAVYGRRSGGTDSTSISTCGRFSTATGSRVSLSRARGSARAPLQAIVVAPGGRSIGRSSMDLDGSRQQSQRHIAS